MNRGKYGDDGDVDSFIYTYNEAIRQSEEKSRKKKESDPSYNSPDQPKSQSQYHITFSEKKGEDEKQECENEIRSLLFKLRTLYL